MNATTQKWNAPLLITGSTRTGTTALATALSMHPDVMIYYECRLYDPGHDALHTILYRLAHSSNMAKWGMTREELCEKLKAKFKDGTPADVLRDYLFSLAEKPPKVYGDKVPRLYLRKIPKLRGLHPQMKMICCIRDGRDCVVSMQAKFKYRFARAVRNWTESMQWWQRYKVLLKPEQYFEVRYEHTAQHKLDTLRDLCAWLDVELTPEFEKAFMEFYNPRSIGRWQKEYPNILKDAGIEFNDQMKAWGYGK